MNVNKDFVRGSERAAWERTTHTPSSTWLKIGEAYFLYRANFEISCFEYKSCATVSWKLEDKC